MASGAGISHHHTEVLQDQVGGGSIAVCAHSRAVPLTVKGGAGLIRRSSRDRQALAMRGVAGAQVVVLRSQNCHVRVTCLVVLLLSPCNSKVPLGGCKVSSHLKHVFVPQHLCHLSAL